MLRISMRALATLVTTLALAGASSAHAMIIYQAFNQKYVDVERQLDELKGLGYDTIQVSPTQKSLDVSDWWSVYQPLDYSILDNRLGNGDQLGHLIREAHARGLKVLVDVVLNHLADPVMSGHNDLQYPQFSWRDFHYSDSRNCISDWNDRHQVTQHWLCDPSRNHHLADLDTSSEYVRGVHRQHLQKLLDLGADGFRFDAMKHIEPEYFAALMPHLPSDKFYYGEVIGSSLDESHLYTGFMPVTDFHLLGVMLNAFSLNGDLRWLTDPESAGGALAGRQAVVFSRNHDTAMSPTFFNFGDYRDAMLANAYVIGRGVGTPLVYRDDYRDPIVMGAVKFRKRLEGHAAYVRGTGDICADCDPKTTLFVERGDVGVMIINSGNFWLDTVAARMPGLAVGCYKELSNNFTMAVAQGGDGQKWISRWGSPARGGLRIGPRSALFFAKTSDNDCR